MTRPGGAWAGLLRRPESVTAAFLVVSLTLVWFHELWRDEAALWLIARDSGSLADAWQALRYGGHGSLWPLVVWLVHGIFAHPLAMQVAHVLLAAGSVYLCLRFAPFPQGTRLLIPFSYYFFFEYSVISRHYAMTTLCLIGFLANCSSKRPRLVAQAVLLALLAQTTVYGLLIALSLALTWISTRVPEWHRAKQITRQQLVAAGLIAALGFTAGVLDLIPPEDSGFAVGWHIQPSLSRAVSTLGTVWRSYLPIPLPGEHFWNTNLLQAQPGLAAALSTAILVTGGFLLRSSSTAVMLWATGTFALLLFTYTKYLGYQRHHGHLFLVFFASCWLAGLSNPRQERRSWARRPLLLLLPLLAVQVAVGSYAYLMDLRLPFSGGKEVARFLRAHELDALSLIADRDLQAMPVALYLGRSIYYPRSDREGTYVILDARRRRKLTKSDLVEGVRRRVRERDAPALLVLSHRGWKLPGDFELLHEVTRSVVADERHRLYLIRPESVAPRRAR